jgi:hypothetical protein
VRGAGAVAATGAATGENPRNMHSRYSSIRPLQAGRVQVNPPIPTYLLWYCGGCADHVSLAAQAFGYGGKEVTSNEGKVDT